MRLFTIPNLMTLFRLLITIPIVYFIFSGNVVWALVLLLLGIISDADGAVARKLKQTSKFGEIFDPITDGIFIGAPIIVLSLMGKISIFLVGILIGIWGLVTIGVLLIYLRTKKVKNVYAGKILGMLSFLVIPLAILEFIYFCSCFSK